jgi:hypothetical protein
MQAVSPPVASAAVGIAVGVLIHLALHAGGLKVQEDNRQVWTVITLPVLLYGLHFRARASRAWHTAYVVVLTAVTAFFARAFAGTVLFRLRQPSEWDFLGFWLHARSAVNGLNFYDPASIARWELPIPVDGAFREEILEIAFWYPPPSMLLLAPLGWLSWPQALAFWSLLQSACLAAGIVLLHRIVFAGKGVAELVVTSAMVLIASGTILTVLYAQTTFMLLLAFLLFWHFRHRPLGGVFLALSMFIKPFVGILVCWLLLRKQWPALRGFFLACLVFVLASVVAFGPQTFASYVVDLSSETKPHWIYDQDTNQSLLGLFLRLAGAICGGADCLRFLPYVVSAVLITGLTAWVAFRLRDDDERVLVALLLLLGFLVYPVTQSFYGVLLVPLLLFAWQDRERFPLPPYTAIGAIVLVYFLMAWQAAAACLVAWVLVFLPAARRALTQRLAAVN